MLIALAREGRSLSTKLGHGVLDFWSALSQIKGSLRAAKVRSIDDYGDMPWC
jgi:hypothetical protein